MKELTLHELLETLGYTDDEHTTINTESPGHPFTSRHATLATLDYPRSGANVWFGVNPVRPGTTGRGTAKHITRLAALYVDIDIKPGGVKDHDTARAIIDDLGTMLGAYPAATTYTGHGLQPCWPVDPEDGQIRTEEDRGLMQAILRRFARLARLAASQHDGKLDSVFDLPRILRAPGTENIKNPDDIKQTVTLEGNSTPLTIQNILDAFDAYSIPEADEDTQVLGEPISQPNTWEHGAGTCAYVRKMITSWETETPEARHPWLVSCHTRIAAAHRTGCLTHADQQKAITTVNNRFLTLLRNAPQRDPGPGELTEAQEWGVQKISTKTDAAVWAEIGDHTHETVEKISPIATTADIFTNNTSSTQAAADGNTAIVTSLQDYRASKEESLLHSDDGLALGLVNDHYEHIRYCTDKGRWLAWNGHKWDWQPVGGGHVRELAKRRARAFPDTDRPQIKAKERALSATGVTNTLLQASTDPRITCTMDDLDAHPWEINTPGGIINLKTGELMDSNPARLHTRSTLHTPDFEADMTFWKQFLQDTFGDRELIGYVQRLIGYSIVGEVREHLLPFSYGSGGNGKSVLFECTTSILGGYATSSPSGFLMKSAYQQHSTEIARLAGARFVTCSEVNETDKFDEAKVKQLTGGDRLTARFMRQDDFTFTPTHHLWLAGNFQPAVLSGGEGFWRRVKLIPFTRTVPAEKRIQNLSGILAAEHGPAILAWIVEGAKEYAQSGLQEPPIISEATRQYATDTDTVGRFIEEECHTATGSSAALLTVRTNDLQHAYRSWCRVNGEEPLTGRQFSNQLRRHGVLVGKDAPKGSKGVRLYGGISLMTVDGFEGDGNE